MTLDGVNDLNKEKIATPSWTSLAVFFVFISGLQYFNLKHPYGENISPLQMHYKFNNGPFKNIFTTQEVYLYYTQLAEDINKIYQPNRRILFFDNFPAGYIFSDMRPTTNAIWTLPISFSLLNRQAIVNYLKEQHLTPDIIFKIRSTPLSDILSKYKDSLYKYESYDPLNQLITNYQLVLQREGYDIYQLTTTIKP